MAYHQDPASAVSGRDHAVAVDRPRRHRFFNQHVLAGPQRRQGRLEMVVDVRDDTDRFDLRIGQQLMIVAVIEGDAESPLDLPPPLIFARANGPQVDIRKRRRHFGMLFAMGYPICALRPTGIYGLAHPASDSHWFDLVRQVVDGQKVHCSQGGKEVHAADVAKAVQVLLDAPAEKVRGEAFNCYDLYVSQWDVAHLAKEVSGSTSVIEGKQTAPKNQIRTEKLRSLGMKFGGKELLRQTIEQLVAAARE